MQLTLWAFSNAERFLSSLGNRWLHVQEVGRQAHRIAKAVPPADRDLLIASAYLHDVGYSPELATTGFHPLDGARWIRDYGPGGRLASLVAHHSCAVYEARMRGVDETLLAEFKPEESATYDALVFCDMTTSPTGKTVTLEERLDEIIQRYGPEHAVTRALAMSRGPLTACYRRTLARLNESAT